VTRDRWPAISPGQGAGSGPHHPLALCIIHSETPLPRQAPRPPATGGGWGVGVLAGGWACISEGPTLGKFPENVSGASGVVKRRSAGHSLL